MIFNQDFLTRSSSETSDFSLVMYSSFFNKAIKINFQKMIFFYSSSKSTLAWVYSLMLSALYIIIYFTQMYITMQGKLPFATFMMLQL